MLPIFGQIMWMDFTAWSIFSLFLWSGFLYSSSKIWLWNVFLVRSNLLIEANNLLKVNFIDLKG